MELRSASYLHFIQAIKGGSVAKSMNMDTHGRPALRFKGIKDIYNLRDIEVPKIYLRDDLENSPTKCNAVKVESPNYCLMRGMKVKSEPEASDSRCNNDAGGRNDDPDDLSFGSMTLKQIKKRCKTKKRKHLSSAGLNKETMETCSSVKHGLPDLENKDDGYDLEEPLISWKSKLSKNKKKRKRKSSRKSLVNCDEQLRQPNGDQSAPIKVKVEVPEPGYTDGQTTFSITSVSSPNCSDQVDSIYTVSNEVPETTNVHAKEPECCSLNEVSHEYQENFEPKFDVGVSSWEIVKVDSPEVISYDYSDVSEFMEDDYIIPLSYDISSKPVSPRKDYSCDIHDSRQSDSRKQEMPWQTCNDSLNQPETIVACGLETGAILHPIEEPLCSFSNGASYESFEDVDFGSSVSGWEIVKVDNPETVSYQCSDLQQFGKESYALYPLPYDLLSESISPTENHFSDLDDSSKSNSSKGNMALQISNEDQIEVPEMDNDNGLECVENINEGSACSFESRSRHDKPSNIRNIIITPSSDNGLYWRSSCLNPDRHSVTVSGHSPSSGKQFQSPASIATTADASDKPMAAAAPQVLHEMKQKHRPERLLSSRKTISPTSKERLCRAMELTGLDENEHHECRGKLYFGKQTNHRILRVHLLDQVRRNGATIKPESIMRKANQDKKGSPPKGVLKVTHPSRSEPCVTSACTTVQGCSRSAVAFTQRQLQDIESITTKLTTELKLMKDIVKRKLHSKSEALGAKENADEVRIAIENATKAEEYAGKWLAMMTRDCTRFCKIMKLAEDHSAASERVVHKERKITFADEAGGKLCHVKVFKNDMGTASLPESGSEKQTAV